jgi:hypothetical protein
VRHFVKCLEENSFLVSRTSYRKNLCLTELSNLDRPTLGKAIDYLANITKT